MISRWLRRRRCFQDIEIVMTKTEVDINSLICWRLHSLKATRWRKAVGPHFLEVNRRSQHLDIVQAKL